MASDFEVLDEGVKNGFRLHQRQEHMKENLKLPFPLAGGPTKAVPSHLMTYHSARRFPDPSSSTAFPYIYPWMYTSPMYW